jgi:hypothetical protein
MQRQLGCWLRADMLGASVDQKMPCRFALPNLLWVGVHQMMLERDYHPADLQPLSDLDTRKLQRLLQWRPRIRALWHDSGRNEHVWRLKVE